MAELKAVLQTGQHTCYDMQGNETPCKGSGQDGDYLTGVPWPEPRLIKEGETVVDQLTGLTWTRNANPNDFPLQWLEALDLIREYNRENYLGYDDWRLPNRNELRSLMSYQAKKPSLQEDHPFTNVFLNWYWSSTSSAVNTAYAWYVHLEGARMFYGRKDQYCLVWPVRGTPKSVLLRTGQGLCYDGKGERISCENSGQDAEFLHGLQWPEPRYEVMGELVRDRLTNLGWPIRADLTYGVEVDWQQGLDLVKKLNRDKYLGVDGWRLPNINELASLVDCSQHSPALPKDHPFTDLQEGYWSSTTSYFEPDWSWVLYMNKGACGGVGYKPGKTFFVWPVFGETDYPLL